MRIPCGPSATRRRPRRAFTLIELLVVIAIIGLLSAILFPVFGMTREKARMSSCASNLKQFEMAILQYNADNDDMMPLCVKTADGAGPGMVGVGGITQEFGVPVAILPYTKNTQIFQCPDDQGFTEYGTFSKAAGQLVPNGMKAWQAYGTSYKFNFDSFSLAPASTVYAYPTKYTSVADKGSAGAYDKTVYPKGLACLTGGSCTSAGNGGADPPYPMSLAFFARPAETMVMHCYLNSWTAPTNNKADNVARQHQNGTVYGFADGHVKTLISKTQSESFCDGPTYSPVRNSGQPNFDAKGDGSCNTTGVERNKN